MIIDIRMLRYDYYIGSITALEFVKKYLISEEKDPRGRVGYNLVTMLKVVLFAYIITGSVSTRKIEKMCVNEIRFRWLLQNENNNPTHMTICNFMNNYLKDNIENIFKEINNYIFKKENVELNHIYIYGTKMEANANKYSWVWKNACLTARTRLYTNITELLEELNENCLCYEMTRYTTREEYEIEYLESIFDDFKNRFKIDTTTFVCGKGMRKSIYQRFYEKLNSYLTRLKDYAYKVENCGEKRNSFL